MKGLFKSFAYAFQGLWFALRNERNMRIHLLCMLYMYYYLLRYDFFMLSRAEWAALLLANALVLVSELLNTALEAVTDLVVQRYASLAKLAKDTAAAAVLVAAGFAVMVGVALLWQPEAFRQLYQQYRTHPALFAVFLASLALGCFFVFGAGKKKRNPGSFGE